MFTRKQDEQPLEQSSNIKDEFTEDFAAWKVNINKFMDDNPTIPFDYPQAKADWFKERIEDPLANDPEDFKKKYPIAYQNIMNNEAQRKAEREQAQTSRVYLDVPYMERKTAKAAGAKWDTTETKWYVEGDTSRVQKWLPEKDNELARQAAPALENKPETAQEKQQPLNKDRQYLNVPYDDKSEAKIAGAKWDRTAKSWYAPEGVAGLDRWKPENTKTPVQTISPAEEFKQALQDHGLIIKGLPEMDGNWHRVALEDDSKAKKSGSYRGFLDGIPNGQIKNFKDGQDAHQWVSTGSQMSEAERIEYKREIENRKAERETKLKEQHKEVAKVAYGRIVNAKPALPDHPYLQKKGIQPNGLKLHEASNSILVPLQDTSGFIWSTQAISESGDKLFMKNSRKEGLFHIMGETDLKTAKEFTIVEGVATGASIHEATKKPVIIAFDSGNLKPVAEAIRAINPEAKILIAGDNDHALVRKESQKQNIGITKAKEAAEAVGGAFTFPSFTKEQKEKGLSDFNDLAQDKGLSAVTKALAPKRDKQQAMAV